MKSKGTSSKRRRRDLWGFGLGPSLGIGAWAFELRRLKGSAVVCMQDVSPVEEAGLGKSP